MGKRQIWALFVTFMLFGGCASIRESERIVVVAMTDFTPYTSRGFLFTPEQYLGNYESVGLIKEYVWPAIRKRVPGAEIDDARWSLQNLRGTYWEVERLDTKSVIDTFYSKAVKAGANAVMRFAISQSPILDPNGLVTYCYEVTKFAIKRKPPK